MIHRTLSQHRVDVSQQACVVLICVGLLSIDSHGAATAFPRKPIKIVVYMAPGGLIDATARQFTEVAKKYTDATFVVENKVGAGGIVAMKHVLQKPADGYTLFACTKSNISKIVAAHCEDLLPLFHWTALLMRDPECIITLKESELSQLPDLIRDAKRQAGNQIWVGPARGGLDHVMALKTWEEFDIEAKWIPYKSGGAAKSALLGQQGVAYVGNPRDASGNSQYYIAALSSPNRLPQFPSTPTFGEFGVEGLDNEFMWRGFALKNGCDSAVLSWYQRLFEKVTQDTSWRSYWEKDGIDVVNFGADKFREIVDADRREFSTYLTRLKIINKTDAGALRWFMHDAGRYFLFFGSGFFAVVISLAVSKATSNSFGQSVIPVSLATCAAVVLFQVLSFPNNETAGPDLLPTVFAVAILSFSLAALCLSKQTNKPNREDRGPNSLPTHMLLIGVCAYLICVYLLGYLLATCLFLCSSIFYLGVRKKILVCTVAITWLLISFFIFMKLLYVPLPEGMIWQLLF